MVPTDIERAKELFNEAIELAPDERATFLDRLRGESSAVCGQVESMLSDYQAAEAQGFLDTPAAADDATIDNHAPEQTMAFVSDGGSLGQRADSLQPVPCLADDYEVLEELGKGGMGVVYRAYQRSLRRYVAVKIIPTHLIRTPEESARFYLEAEAAARLDHPGIVPVQEVGERNGVHFYTMALVTGGSLNDYVGHDGDHKQPPLPVRRAAEIIEAVSRAVQYAHDHAVIHRDIKPANILLDGEGHPRLTDFGLAKLTNTDDHLTMTGQVMGTPSYMAPEQAEGDSRAVTNRTDVYSLGATLYALLAGRAPFSGETLFNTLNMVKNSPPSALPATVPLDLRTICEKCLAKLPADRYESGGKLADDLRRYLDGFPIAARPLGPVQRAERWVRRNPLVAALWVFVLLGAVAAVGFGVEAVRQAGIATRNLAKSEADNRRLEAALHDMVATSEEVLPDQPGMQGARKLLLEGARKYYEQLLESGDAPPERAAHAAFSLANVYTQLGGFTESQEAFGRALEIQQQLLEAAASGSSDQQVAKLAALAQTHNDYARLGEKIWHVGREAMSPAKRDEGLRLWQLHAERALEYRQRAAAASPDDAELQRKYAHGLMNLAMARLEDPEESSDPEALGSIAEQLAEAQRLRSEIAHRHQQPAAVERDLALGYAALADHAEREASITADEAGKLQCQQRELDYRTQVVEHLRNLPEGFRDRRMDWLLATSYHQLGLAHAARGMHHQAIGDFQRMLAVVQRLLTRHPNVAEYRLYAAECAYNLGQLLLFTRDNQSYSIFELCQQTLVDGLIVDPSNQLAIERLSEYTAGIATCLLEMKLYDQARGQIDRAVDLLEGLPSQTRGQAFVTDALNRLEQARQQIEQQAEEEAESPAA